MSNFKAIPTTYNGTVFRSRFESEIAMLLDKLGLSWEYEPKSFLLSSGHYMPDFFIPTMNLWIEARGYDGKDWQITEFQSMKPEGHSYVVFKPDTKMFISINGKAISFDAYNALLRNVKVSMYAGHLVIDDRGKAYSVMEWAGFVERNNFDLANVLLEERAVFAIQPLDPRFYSMAMEHLNRLTLDAKNETDPVEKQILDDTVKVERASLIKLIDNRMKKLTRLAIRSSRAAETPNLAGMTAEESGYLSQLILAMNGMRESIYDKAFSEEN